MGSTVSTISENFNLTHLSHLTVHPLQNVLKIEHADGELLPYAGYIIAKVAGTGLRSKKPMNAFF